MKKKAFHAAVIAAVALALPEGPAKADSNLAAGLIGGIIGGAIVNEANRNHRTTTVRRTYSGVSSATRAQNVETQQALNFFGFPAGTPDGVLGRRSRDAVAQYQGYMGYPMTGELSPYERTFLVSSYNRAQIGGPMVQQALASSSDGMRGLLRTWRDEAAGGGTTTASTGTYNGMPVEVSRAVDEIAASSDPTAEQLLQRAGFIQLADMNGDGRTDYLLDTSVTGSGFWCGAQSCSVIVFASTPSGYVRNDFLARNVTPAMFTCQAGSCTLNADGDTGGTMAAAPAAPVAPAAAEAPTVMAAAPAPQLQAIPMATADAAQTSLGSFCNKVSLVTGSNGGFVTAATAADADTVLAEQFCLTRTYAMSQGEEMVQRVKGLTAAQVDAQCDSFGTVMAAPVSALGTEDRDAVLAQVRQVVLSTPMSADQLRATAQLCLYSAYTRDKMDVSLGAALALVGLGDAPYAELVGHHLAQGFGVTADMGRAEPWFDLAYDALKSGAPPVFMPGQPERMELVHTAALTRAGKAPVADPVPAAQEGTLPAFSFE